MSVRQYIGARYVTKIYENSLDPSSAEWEANINYEPLTMVTFNYGSYLSKKQVPASIGNPADNPTYWAQTGFYNGQISNLQNQINSLNAVISSINSPTIRNISERKFVFVGDSYTQVPTPDTSFVGVCAGILGLSNTQYHNIGVSGVDMNGFITQVNNYSYGDANDITDVVVTGGINDAHIAFGSSTLSTTIPQLITAIKTTFPNAVIWAGFSGNGYYTNLQNDYPNFTYNNVQNIKYLWERHFGTASGVIYMDGLDEWMRDLTECDYYVPGGSGLHPNSFGITVLASKIANYLKGGSRFDMDLTANSDCILSVIPSYSLWTGDGMIKYERIGSLEYARIKHAGINLSSEITLTTTPFALLEEPASNSRSIAAMRDASISTPLFYTVTGDSTFKVLMANFIFRDQQILIGTPTAVSPIANVNSVWYPDLEFVLPANAI